MKITISRSWIDSDDSMMELEIAAETPDFKGTAPVYGYGGMFDDFADSLLKFPFESKEPIIFEAGQYDGETTVRITITLREQRGAIDFDVVLRDNWGNKAEFSDSSVKAQALHDFANTLKHTDLLTVADIAWDTRTYETG